MFTGGGVGEVVAVGATVTVAVGVELAVAVVVAVEVAVAVGVGEGVGVAVAATVAVGVGEGVGVGAMVVSINKTQSFSPVLLFGGGLNMRVPVLGSPVPISMYAALVGSNQRACARSLIARIS